MESVTYDETLLGGAVAAKRPVRGERGQAARSGVRVSQPGGTVSVRVGSHLQCAARQR